MCIWGMKILRNPDLEEMFRTKSTAIWEYSFLGHGLSETNHILFCAESHLILHKGFSWAVMRITYLLEVESCKGHSCNLWTSFIILGPMKRILKKIFSSLKITWASVMKKKITFFDSWNVDLRDESWRFVVVVVLFLFVFLRKQNISLGFKGPQTHFWSVLLCFFVSQYLL